MHPVKIAPSILSADFANLAAEVAAVAAGGADFIHFDVMDGHFVPNLTIGAPVAKSLRKATDLKLDCHLMVTNPDDLLEAFAAAGADMLSVHIEASAHLHRTIQRIRALGMSPGVALNPHTAFSTLEPILPDLDFVLVMSVNPGFGGQQFIPGVLPKVAAIDAWRQANNPALRIEIDGGIKASTIGAARAAGVDWFVAGSAVFRAESYAEAIAALKKAAGEAVPAG